MTQFFIWFFMLLFFTGATIVSGYKAKEAWDNWHRNESANKANGRSQVVINQMNGDFVNGNKTVIGNQVNVNASVPEQSDNRAKIDVAKLKIKRAFEDFNKAIDEVASNFLKESNKIANLFNLHNVLSGGEHIQKQMDLSINTKKELDQQFQDLQRKIENVLIEDLGKTSLQSAGDEFNEQQKLLDQAQSRCRALYPLLNDNPKSWEMKALRENTLTKDFDVTNDHGN